MTFLLSKNGISHDDVTIVKAGSSTFPPALKNGDIDGGIALEPFASTMVEQGDAYVLQRMITAADSKQAFGGPYNLAGIVTRQNVIDTNPEQVQKVVNAIVRALRWMQAHTDGEIADALTSEVVGSDKARYVKTLYLLREFFSPDGTISTVGADNVLKAMNASGILTFKPSKSPFDFLDSHFVNATTKNTSIDKFPRQMTENHKESSLLHLRTIMLPIIVGVFSGIVLYVIILRKKTNQED